MKHFGTNLMRRDIFQMRKDIISTLRYSLTQQGRTLSQIKPNVSADILECDRPVWHTPQSLMKEVADHLRLDPSIWNKDRDTNDFRRLIQNEITKYRRQGYIVGPRGAFRCTHPQQYEPARPTTNKIDQVPLDKSNSGMMQAFLNILHPAHGSKDNTYKFALARAILDHCQNTTSLHIPYEDLAKRFLKYYWHQVCKYHIRQDFHTTKKAAVITIIQDAFKKPPGSFDLCDKKDIDYATNRIQKKVFGHAGRKTSIVVHKFQNLKRGRYVVEQRYFYEPDDDAQMIHLTKEAHDFFRQNQRILYNLVFYQWAKFLERINGSLPMLMSKVEQDELQRGSLIQYRNRYLKYTNHCFYCNGTLRDDQIEVDHFIPWSYIFEDEAWNLVLACRECNRKKSNSLPQEKFRDELIDRNRTYQGRIDILYKSLKRLGRDKRWSDEIITHYDNCESYGFPLISLP